MTRLPDFLTVEEAARVLRIGRTTAYQLAQLYRSTDGAEGLPVLAVGRLLRVPTAKLTVWAGGELQPLDDRAPASVVPVEPRVERRSLAKVNGPRKPPPSDRSQSPLPFSS